MSSSRKRLHDSSSEHEPPLKRIKKERRSSLSDSDEEEVTGRGGEGRQGRWDRRGVEKAAAASSPSGRDRLEEGVPLVKVERGTEGWKKKKKEEEEEVVVKVESELRSIASSHVPRDDATSSSSSSASSSSPATGRQRRGGDGGRRSSSSRGRGSRSSGGGAAGRDQGSYEWGVAADGSTMHEDGEKEEEERERKRRKAVVSQKETVPDYSVSGLLEEVEQQKVNGVAMKWQEVADGAVPRLTWYLFCFKDGKVAERFQMGPDSGKSWFLAGRERKVADIPTDHPSCSSQHAVVQFRRVDQKDDTGCLTGRKVIRPYIIDLESTNGTSVNGDALPTMKLFELRSKDMIQFAFSSRQYVLLNERSIGALGT